MGAPRTAFQRECDRAKVAQLYLTKRSINQIAEEIGRSRITVMKDLKAIRAGWFEASMEAVGQRKAEELARIDRIELAAWEGYERSIMVREITKTVLEQGGLGGQKTKAESRKEALIGDPRWLDKVAWCVEQRSKILGLYAPTKSEGKYEHEHHHTVQTEFDREFETLVGQLDGRAEIAGPGPGERLPRGFAEPR
jgi:predicted transcriptional regulator